MKGIKFLLILLGIGMFLVTSWSGQFEKVLQNGLDNYDGCEDAFVLSKAGYENENYGDADSLELRYDDG